VRILSATIPDQESRNLHGSNEMAEAFYQIYPLASDANGDGIGDIKGR
jgi:hypothetical protein